MLKRKWFFIAVLAFAVCIATISLPAAAAAEISSKTLVSGDVSVSGKFEENAALTVTVSPYTEEVLEELVARKQVTNEKSIINVYDIQASGEQLGDPAYRIVIKNVVLSQFVKNKISIIDENGVYYAIPDFDYVNQTISFDAPVLGDVIIYKDTSVLSLVIAFVGLALLLILIAKIVAAQRYKGMKAGTHARKQVREHERKYW